MDPQGRFLSVSDSVPGGANHDLTLLRDSRLLDQLPEGEAAMTMAFDIEIKGKVALPDGGV